MIRILLAFAVFTVAACKDEIAQDISAVPLSVEAVGHFCQMDLFEHEGPKAQAHLAGLPQMPLFFSQVRDVVAYQRLPEQSHEILAIWVNDMGAAGATWAAPGVTNWIDAQDAVFVVGSRVMGGMGAPELVPFSDRDKAIAFAQANGGTIMDLAGVPDTAVLTPVVFDGESDDADFEQRLRDLSRAKGD